jgi:hypothetical protein
MPQRRSHVPEKNAVDVRLKEADARFPVPVLCLFYRKTPAVMDREEGREALIFCRFLLVIIDLADLHETRNQVYGEPHRGFKSGSSLG